MRRSVPALALVLATALASCGGDDRDDRADTFDADAAMTLLEEQVALGPRPSGSPASRQLADRLRRELPNGTFQRVPGGLRNVVGRVEGRDPDRVVVVGAHYDTYDGPDFVGANDGASGTAVVVEIARSLEPRELEPTIVFVLFDGEEAPPGTAGEDFEREGLRGSKVAAAAFRDAEAMVLLDLVGDRDLTFPREAFSDPALWRRLTAAAKRVGHGEHFPRAEVSGVIDDHRPFLEAGVSAIDVIDLSFDCFHRRCDDRSAVSVSSLDATGESVLELLRSW